MTLTERKLEIYICDAPQCHVEIGEKVKYECACCGEHYCASCEKVRSSVNFVWTDFTDTKKEVTNGWVCHKCVKTVMSSVVGE